MSIAKKATPFDFGLNEAVDQARLEYDATPAGMKELTRRIQREQARTRRGERNMQLTEYELRLDLGQAKRKAALAAIKADDRGDMAHATRATEVTFPGEFHRLQTKPYVDEQDIDQTRSQKDRLTNQPKMVKKLIDDSEAWTQQLTVDEIEAVSFFTSDGSFVVNQTLVGNRPTSGPRATDNQRGKDAIAHLDTALAKSKRKKPIRLYRGISDEILEEQGYGRNEADMEKYVSENFEVGKNWSTPVYQSTSLDYQKARGFARSGLTLEILAKHAGPVSNVSAWSVSEAEYIMPRNQQYRVVSVQHFVETLPRRDGGVFTFKRCMVQLEEI